MYVSMAFVSVIDRPKYNILPAQSPSPQKPLSHSRWAARARWLLQKQQIAQTDNKVAGARNRAEPIEGILCLSPIIIIVILI